MRVIGDRLWGRPCHVVASRQSWLRSLEPGPDLRVRLRLRYLKHERRKVPILNRDMRYPWPTYSSATSKRTRR